MKSNLRVLKMSLLAAIFTSVFNPAAYAQTDTTEADAMSPKLSVENNVDDKTITAKVKGELMRNAITNGLDVQVETSQGQVILSGTVNSEIQLQSAEQIAASVAGVKKVVNKLERKG